jgi:hypothetical protein
MVDKWDGIDPKSGNEIPIKPVNGEAGPTIVGPPHTVVKFKAFSDDPAPLQPTTGDRNWGLFVLVLALATAWFIGMLMQAQFHIV